MKSLGTFVGAILLLSGLFFAAQGLGYIQWPAESFMGNDGRWFYYGAGIAFVGIVIIVVGRGCLVRAISGPAPGHQLAQAKRRAVAQLPFRTDIARDRAP